MQITLQTQRIKKRKQFKKVFSLHYNHKVKIFKFDYINIKLYLYCLII